MTLHILIPCKSLGDGKTRLAQALDAKARRVLCTSFLQRTLDVALALVPPPRCHVIASDGDAAAIAISRGVTHCDDPGIGLNEALRQGRERICCNAAEEFALLIFPIDLPWATATVLADLVRRTADVVIAPDRERTGQTRSISVRGQRVGSSSSSVPPASLRTGAPRRISVCESMSVKMPDFRSISIARRTILNGNAGKTTLGPAD